jgi:hypothetical protein
MANSGHDIPVQMKDTDAKYLFHGLAWPAVAGNVAWAFFSLVIAPASDVPTSEWCARAAVLLLMAVYVGGDWVRTRHTRGHPSYWTFDAFHLILICLFVIGTATTKSQWWLNVWLGALFVVTAFGHYSGAFTPEKPDRWWYGSASFLGFIILVIWLVVGGDTTLLIDLDPQGDAWHLVGSVFAALTFWVFFRVKKPWEWPQQCRIAKDERERQRQEAERVRKEKERVATELGAPANPPVVNPNIGQTETDPAGTGVPKPGPHGQ